MKAGAQNDAYILMICRIGSTTHRMIDEEMNFYLENGMTVMGAAALEVQ